MRHTLEAVGAAEIMEFVVVKKQVGEPLRGPQGAFENQRLAPEGGRLRAREGALPVVSKVVRSGGAACQERDV